MAPRQISVASPVELDNTADSVGRALWESWLAVGNQKVISVFHNEYFTSSDPNSPLAPASAQTIGYSVFDRASQSWVGSGVIPAGTYIGREDPCVAADPIGGNFVAVARGGAATGGPNARRYLTVARYNAAMGSWLHWEQVFDASPSFVDRPWIVPGRMTLNQREFYIVFSLGNGAQRYLRSINRGQDWVGGVISVRGVPVAGFPVAPMAAAAGGGPLYVSYTTIDLATPGMDVGFVVGTDMDGPHGENEGVSFVHLESSAGVPLRLTLNHDGALSHTADALPGGATYMKVRSFVFPLADPTDPDRLFVVYHDFDGPLGEGNADFNIYARTLTRQYSGYWLLGARQTINDNPAAPNESDQFHPSATIDANGRIHVIWYDDRRYTDGPQGDLQPDGDDPITGTPSPRFDVYYARCIPSGSGFDISVNELLYGAGVEEGQPALEYPLLSGWEFPDRPGEYDGIGVDGDTVWTTFTGTSHEDAAQEGHNPSVIWSSIIDWTP